MVLLKEPLYETCMDEYTLGRGPAGRDAQCHPPPLLPAFLAALTEWNKVPAEPLPLRKRKARAEKSNTLAGTLQATTKEAQKHCRRNR